MRKLKKVVKIGNIAIGGTNPVAVQTQVEHSGVLAQIDGFDLVVLTIENLQCRHVFHTFD